MRKHRFGMLLGDREAKALGELARQEGESKASVLRRLLRAEATRQGLRPPALANKREVDHA